MRYIFGFAGGLLVGIALCAGVALIWSTSPNSGPISQVVFPTPVPTPLSVYSFDNLRTATPSAGHIQFGQVISETDDSWAQLFSYTFTPNPTLPEFATVSGLANIPKAAGTYPVIVMLRGYVPSSSFRSGVGTQPSATVFARNGFITLAPDFLGFGESSSRSADPYEARFQTYTTTQALLASLSTLNTGLQVSYAATVSADVARVGLWGHSNGGHIALATLALTGNSYPTVLWAPVSKSFPFTQLFFTDEEDDQGKTTRKELAAFESVYDIDQFSPPRYYHWINASVQIHQGSSDIEVPFWWSDELVKTLRAQKLDVDYFLYPGADHNLRPAWNEAVGKSVEFFAARLR